MNKRKPVDTVLIATRVHQRVLPSSKNIRYFVAFLLLPLLLALGVSVSHAALEPTAPSAESIKAKQEKDYAELIKKLKAKDPVKDASDASALGFPYLLGHYAGRSDELIIPSVDMAIYNNNKERCPVLMMDGLGDSIYGKNHLEYRRLMGLYASKFNTVTFKSCLRKK